MEDLLGCELCCEYFHLVDLSLHFVLKRGLKYFISKICKCHVSFHLCAGLDSISF